MILRKCVELFNTNTTIHALHNVIADDDDDDVNDEEEVDSCAKTEYIETYFEWKILSVLYISDPPPPPRTHPCIEKRK